jgi:hypothetical protein
MSRLRQPNWHVVSLALLLIHTAIMAGSSIRLAIFRLLVVHVLWFGLLIAGSSYLCLTPKRTALRQLALFFGTTGLGAAVLCYFEILPRQYMLSLPLGTLIVMLSIGAAHLIERSPDLSQDCHLLLVSSRLVGMVTALIFTILLGFLF